MENIYKIKIRSDLSPQDLYPSERRYSSSIVLGMSTMFLALALTSSLMGSLVVRRITTNSTSNEESLVYRSGENESSPITATINNDTAADLDGDNERLLLKIEKELVYQQESTGGHRLSIPALVSAGCFVMALGHILAGLSGILAWKRWYIDHNITWFFLTCSFSTLTSAISLLLTLVTLLESEEDGSKRIFGEISLGLIANIFITSLAGAVWSILASKVAYKGMKNSYPEDMVLSKTCKGRVEVNTVKKGNKIAKVVPPDILDHFPKTGKLAKYFPNKNEQNGDLPKAESNKEYEERVKKFLTEGQAEAETNN